MKYKNIKRGVDVIGSLCLLAATSPLFTLLTICNSLDQRGNPFFFQKRMGLYGKPFSIIKFKTMKEASDTKGNALPDEVRKTRFGRFLRKKGLDELPQLVNVLKGDMSLVGPRPYSSRLLKLNDYHSFPIIQERQSVLPGLISSTHQIPASRSADWFEKLQLDVDYVKNMSWQKDVNVVGRVLRNLIKNGHDESGVTTPLSDFLLNQKKLLNLSSVPTNTPLRSERTAASLNL